MSVIYNQKFCQPFYTNYRPLKVMRNGKKIAGWHKVSEGFNKNESPKILQGTYNDPLEFTMHGETYQDSTPYVMWNNSVLNCKPWAGHVDNIIFNNCQYLPAGSASDHIQVKVTQGELSWVEFRLDRLPVQGNRYLVLAEANLAVDYFYMSLGGIEGELTRYDNTAWFGSVIEANSISLSAAVGNRSLPQTFIFNLWKMFVIDLELFFNGLYKYSSTEDIIEKVIEVIENPTGLEWVSEGQARIVDYPAYGSFVGDWKQYIKNPFPRTARQGDINKYFPEGTLTFNNDNITLDTGNDGEIVVTFTLTDYLTLGHKYLFYFDTPSYELQPGSTVMYNVNTGSSLTSTISGFAAILNISSYDDHTKSITIQINGTGTMTIKKLNLIDLTELWKGEYTEVDVEDALSKVKQADPAPFASTPLTTIVPIPYIPVKPSPMTPIEPTPKTVWIKAGDYRAEADLHWTDELICDGSKYKINSYMKVVNIGDLDWVKGTGNNKFYWLEKNDILRDEKVLSNYYPLVATRADLDRVDYGIYIEPNTFNKLVYIKDKDFNKPALFKQARKDGKIYYFSGEVNRKDEGDMEFKCTPYSTNISTNTNNTITYKQWDDYDK